MDNILEDDKKIQETFRELRKEVFEIEKLKYKRIQEAAHKKLGVDTSSISSSASKKQKQEEEGTKKNKKTQKEGKASDQQQNEEEEEEVHVGVFANWRRVLVLAFFILVLQWRRLLNLFDVATHNSTATVVETEITK